MVLAGHQPCRMKMRRGVSVDDEAGFAAGIEQHAVGGLGADAVDGQQPVPGFLGGPAPQGSRSAGALMPQVHPGTPGADGL